MFIKKINNCHEEDGTREFEAKIFDDEINGKEVGYLELLEKYDEDGDCEWLYVGTIEIHEAFRNQGRGTAVLRQLAEKYGKVYLCPMDADNERLYARLGEEVKYYHVPENIKGCYDAFGKMFLIEA